MISHLTTVKGPACSPRQLRVDGPDSFIVGVHPDRIVPTSGASRGEGKIRNSGSIVPIYLRLTVLLIVIVVALSCQPTDSTPTATPVPDQDTPLAMTPTATSIPEQNTPVAGTETPVPTVPSGIGGELDGVEYRNAEFPYAILHPEGWQLTESADGQSVQIISEEFFGVIRVLVVPSLLTTIPLEDFVDQHLGAVARVSEVDVLFDPALTTQDGRETVIMAYAYGGADFPFEEFAAFVTHQDDVYLVTVTRSRGLENTPFTTRHIQFLLGTFRILSEGE